MKKEALAGSALLVVAALSCTRELDIETPVSQEYVFEAVWADGSGTRTALQEDGTSVWWTTGEEINVFYGSIASGKFVSTNTEPAALTSFSGSLPVVTGTVEGGHTAPAFWGVYPYDAANTCDGESVALTVPARQPATDGTFADKFFPAVAVSQDFALAFYNVCGGARFSVANTGINAVTFEAVGGENLVGKVKVGFGSDGKPVVRQVSEGSPEVTVNAPAGGFVPGKYYFAAFLPGTLSQGLKVTYRTATQSASITQSNSLTVNRSRFGTIDRKDEGLTFVDGGYAVPEIVDLGLSVKWASFNLGATKPEEYGDYFAWGETEPYYTGGHAYDAPCNDWKEGKENGYDWSSYKWCISSAGSGVNLTKYCSISSWGEKGFTDNKTVLDPEDDAAHVNLGGTWRMPTNAEWGELRNNCTLEEATMNGVKGMKVTSKKAGYTDKYIFLPAAGSRQGWYLFYSGSTTSYWSSTLFTNDPDNAWKDSGVISYRNNGFSIRPVYAVSVESVSLDKSELELSVSGVATLTATVLPEGATNKVISWISSNESVAKVSPHGVVIGVAEGTATITVTTVDGGKTASCNVTVIAPIPYAVPEIVDLGLSVKWASFNLGATKPEEYGDYYAWGETEPYYISQDPLIWKEGKENGYNWSSYKWSMGTYYTLTKYSSNSSYGYDGFTDDKTVLDPEDDAAYVNLGEMWRMPTDVEWTELRNNCTWEWTTMNGVYGRKVTSNKPGYTDKYIFLPAVGRRIGSNLYSAGSYGYYWSSSLCTGNPDGAWDVDFYSGYVSRNDGSRYNGFSVRPVSD